MKAILIGLAFIGSTAFAADPLHCHLTLVTPLSGLPNYMWVAPMTGVYKFDYDPATELIVKLDVEVVPHTQSFPQYQLVNANNSATPALTIEFSKKTPDGNTYSGDGFGVYFRLPTDKPNDSAWVMGGYTEATSSPPISIAGEGNGYVVMNCL